MCTPNIYLELSITHHLLAINDKTNQLVLFDRECTHYK